MATGPYGFSLGYFGEAFDNGQPIEDNWMNRVEKRCFLQTYRLPAQYRPAAWRYSTESKAICWP
jgi:hypothetical protein